MIQYLQLVDRIFKYNVVTMDRTGTGTYLLPGDFCQYEMYQDENGIIHNFPLMTTKFVSLKNVFYELKWKLSGDTNIRYLLKHNNHIWTEWPFEHWLKQTGRTDLIARKWKDGINSDYTDEWKMEKAAFEKLILEDDEFCKLWGDLGHTYGYEFRHFGQAILENVSLGSGAPHILVPGIDQLMQAEDMIVKDPTSRRIIIVLFNPKDVGKTLLPPCPSFYEFIAAEDGVLHLNMFQRSCDMFLGVPYNIAQDSLFLCMMASITGRKPKLFNHFLGNAHIYLNHVEQIKEQLSRTPHPLPSIRFKRNVTNITDFEWEDFELIGYEHDAAIKGAVSI